MTLIRLAAISAFFAVSCCPALALDCKSGAATYAMAGADGFELTFSKATEPNAWSLLSARLKTPERSLTFSLTASNGYSINYLVLEGPDATDDSSFPIYAFDDRMEVQDLPQLDRPAPQFLFVPELGLHLYYGLVDGREYLPIALWRLASCG